MAGGKRIDKNDGTIPPDRREKNEMEKQTQMNTTQRKSALPADTEEDAHEKTFWLYITTTPPLCQILRGAAAWASFIGLLGMAGGMEQETISFLPGCFWMAALLLLFDWGSKPWQG